MLIILINWTPQNQSPISEHKPPGYKFMHSDSGAAFLHRLLLLAVKFVNSRQLVLAPLFRSPQVAFSHHSPHPSLQQGCLILSPDSLHSVYLISSFPTMLRGQIEQNPSYKKGRFNSIFSGTPSLNCCFYVFLNSPKTHCALWLDQTGRFFPSHYEEWLLFWV